MSADGRYDNSKVARNIDIDESGDVLVEGRGVITSWHFGHVGTGTVYVKLYDKLTAPTQADTPILTLPIEAVLPSSLAALDIEFTLGLGIRATTGVADNNTGAPAANDVVGFVGYKEMPNM